MNITDTFDLEYDEEYLIKFHEPKFAKWDGIYKLIETEFWAEHDHFDVEYHIFRNSSGLTILADLFMEQWNVLVKNDNQDLCEYSDEIYVDEEGTYADNIGFTVVDVIDEQRNDRWEGRTDFLCYLEQSQVKQNSTNAILDNKDLTRYITDYL